LQGYQFVKQTPDQLARNFGDRFVMGLQKALQESQSRAESGDGRWLGPIRSVYGLHYVWLSRFEPARDAELKAVEQQLRVDLEYAAGKQALQCAIAALRLEFEFRGRTLQDADEAGRCE
jgi:hypothetical protein